MDALRLKGVDEFGEAHISEQLKANIVSFFNWGLLNVGGFSNVSYGANAAFGGDKSRLRAVTEDKYFTPGQVWEGFRQDWVWERNLDYHTQPVSVSGVKVNGTFYPADETGAYSHYIDYPLGRIVFNNPINTNSVVTAEYSFRYYNFTTSDVPWFREFLFNSYRVDSPHFLQQGSGNWATTIGGARVQLPAVVVELVPRRRLRPLMLGGGHWVEQDVLFHIFAQEPWEKDKLVDILSTQRDKTILSFNKNKLLEDNAYPLDYRGSLKENANMYPALVTGNYFWKKIFFKETTTQEVTSQPPLYRAIVRTTFEIDCSEF